MVVPVFLLISTLLGVDSHSVVDVRDPRDCIIHRIVSEQGPSYSPLWPHHGGPFPFHGDIHRSQEMSDHPKEPDVPASEVKEGVEKLLARLDILSSHVENLDRKMATLEVRNDSSFRATVDDLRALETRLIQQCQRAHSESPSRPTEYRAEILTSEANSSASSITVDGIHGEHLLTPSQQMVSATLPEKTPEDAPQRHGEEIQDNSTLEFTPEKEVLLEPGELTDATKLTSSLDHDQSNGTYYPAALDHDQYLVLEEVQNETDQILPISSEDVVSTAHQSPAAELDGPDGSAVIQPIGFETFQPDLSENLGHNRSEDTYENPEIPGENTNLGDTPEQDEVFVAVYQYGKNRPGAEEESLKLLEETAEDLMVLKDESESSDEAGPDEISQVPTMNPIHHKHGNRFPGWKRGNRTRPKWARPSVSRILKLGKGSGDHSGDKGILDLLSGLLSRGSPRLEQPPESLQAQNISTSQA